MTCESCKPRRGVSLYKQHCFFGSGTLEQGAMQRPKLSDFYVYRCVF